MSTSILGVGYINISCKIPNGKVLVHEVYINTFLFGTGVTSREHGGNLDIRELTKGKQFGYVTRFNRRVPLVEKKLLTHPGYLSLPRVLVLFVLLDL